MKKIIAGVVAALAFCAVAWVFFLSGAPASHSVGSVSLVVHSVADSNAAPIVERSTVVGGRGSKVKAWVNHLAGRRSFHDTVSLRAKDVRGDLRIVIIHNDGQAGEVRIIPDSGFSSVAATMKKEILASLPGIACTVEKP